MVVLRRLRSDPDTGRANWRRARVDASTCYVSRDFNDHPAFAVLTRGKDVDLYTPSCDIVFPRSGSDHLVVIDQRQLDIVPTLRRLYPRSPFRGRR